MVYTCCAPGCNSDQRKLRNLKKYPWMKNVTFHAFPHRNRPNDRRLHKKWLEQIKRDSSFLPNKHTRVCSLHFVGHKGPTNTHPVPTLFARNIQIWDETLYRLAQPDCFSGF